jgi:hypothetical protein
MFQSPHTITSRPLARSGHAGQEEVHEAEFGGLALLGAGA